MGLQRLMHAPFLALALLLSAFGFPPPVSPRHAIRPSQEQAEPARKS